MTPEPMEFKSKGVGDEDVDDDVDDDDETSSVASSVAPPSTVRFSAPSLPSNDTPGPSATVS